MMKLNQLIGELKAVIGDRCRYSNGIILYAMASLELINNNNITDKLTKHLKPLEQYLTTVDFNDHQQLSLNKNYSTSSNSSSGLGSSASLLSSISIEKQIDIMLEKDAKIMKDIMDTGIKKESIVLKNKYGDIEEELLIVAKDFFDRLDENKDGYITPIEVIKLVELNNKHKMAFTSDLNQTLVNLFLQHKNKIDFDTFFIYLV